MARRNVALIVTCLIALACDTSSIAALVPTSAAATHSLPNASAGPMPTDAIVAIPLHVGYGFRGPWFDLYFTDPSNPDSPQFTGGVDEPLAAAIDAARLSVDAAIYSLSLHNVVNALIRAHRRGLDVRVVMESDNLEAAEPQAVRDAGIPVLGDRREGTMHNKFLVVDRSEVWTGSMNPTFSGAFSQNNNYLRVRSKDLADDYAAEFDEMYVKDIFGPQAGDPTPKPRVVLDGVELRVYFSPDDDVQAALVKLLDGAKSSINFLAYSFTSDALGDAIRRRAAAGVAVAGVMDADQVKSNVGTEFDAFRAARLDVRLDGNPDAMHEKVFIVDGETVVTGSYNFTRSANTTNDENILVIRDASIASAYLQEFDRVYALAQP